MNSSFHAPTSALVPRRSATSPRLSALPAAGLPDWDDDEWAATRFDATPFAIEDAAETAPASLSCERRQLDSYVRARPGAPSAEEARQLEDAVVFVEGMGDDQLNLSLALDCLENPFEGMPTYDLSARAAAQTLRCRAQELVELRDALHQLYRDAADPRLLVLFTPDAALSAYVKGLYLWASEAAAALIELAAGLRTLEPCWRVLRARLSDAADWYFDELPPEIRAEAKGIRIDLADAHEPLRELDDHLEELFWTAAYLSEGLEKRFG